MSTLALVPLPFRPRLKYVSISGLLPQHAYYYELVSGGVVFSQTLNTPPTLDTIPPVDQVHGYVYQVPSWQMAARGEGLQPIRFR